jgi:hypothetical protein
MGYVPKLTYGQAEAWSNGGAASIEMVEIVSAAHGAATRKSDFSSFKFSPFCELPKIHDPSPPT